MIGGQTDPQPRKTTLKKPSLIRVKRKQKSKGIMEKLEKLYDRIGSAQQLLHRTSFCGILELLEHLSMVVSIGNVCNTK